MAPIKKSKFWDPIKKEGPIQNLGGSNPWLPIKKSEGPILILILALITSHIARPSRPGLGSELDSSDRRTSSSCRKSSTSSSSRPESSDAELEGAGNVGVTNSDSEEGDHSLTVTSGTTRCAGKHSLDDPFLVRLFEYLQSRIGGKKDHFQSKEIVVDIAKYLYFADPNCCNPDLVFSRRLIRNFVDSIENGGIGSSGVLKKLTHIAMAIKFLQCESEDLDREVEVHQKSVLALQTIERFSKGLRRDKSRAQQCNLESFTRNLPDISEVKKFLNNPQADHSFRETVEVTKRDGIIQIPRWREAMIIAAGRILLRYVYTISFPHIICRFCRSAHILTQIQTIIGLFILRTKEFIT